MTDALNKIENFLFDILGLVLPGFIFLNVLFLPTLIINISSIPPKDINNSFILSELLTFSKIVQKYWTVNATAIAITVFILSYLVGHFVKVFAIIKYDILTFVFDKSINKLVIFILDKLNFIFNKTYRKIANSDFSNTALSKWLNDLINPLKSILNKIFIFKPADYYSDNDNLKTNCVEKISDRVGMSYPDKWYSVYKFSVVITSQENIKSLAGTFLAKYNLYRSLAFIFIFAAGYYYLFFRAADIYIEPEVKKIGRLILPAAIILWFTFHYKYKRYWTLCGNETLVSLFYFLNKKKVNENG